MLDERRHSCVVATAATEKPQIGYDFLPRIAVAGGLCQMILANPDQPIRTDRAASQPAGLFENERSQAQFVGCERRSQARDGGSENEDVPGIARDPRRSTPFTLDRHPPDFRAGTWIPGDPRRAAPDLN